MTAQHDKTFRMVFKFVHHFLPFVREMVLFACIHTETVQYYLTEAEMETLRALDTAVPMVGTPAKPEKVEMFMR